MVSAERLGSTKGRQKNNTNGKVERLSAFPYYSKVERLEKKEHAHTHTHPS